MKETTSNTAAEKAFFTLNGRSIDPTPNCGACPNDRLCGECPPEIDEYRLDWDMRHPFGDDSQCPEYKMHGREACIRCQHCRGVMPCDLEESWDDSLADLKYSGYDM